MVFPKDRINFFVLATMNSIDGTPLVREYQGQNDVTIPELVVATEELFYAVSAVSNIVSSEYKVTPRDALDTIKYAVFSTDTANPLVLSILNAVSQTAKTFVKEQHGAAQSLLRRLSIMSTEMSRAIGSTLEKTKERPPDPFMSILVSPSPYPQEVTVDFSDASDLGNSETDVYLNSERAAINAVNFGNFGETDLGVFSSPAVLVDTPNALAEQDPFRNRLDRKDVPPLSRVNSESDSDDSENNSARPGQPDTLLTQLKRRQINI